MQRIHVKNFKAIKLADVEIKKTVLLIGEQASGKSTLAKLVYFFKSIKDDYLNVISENIETLNSNRDVQLKFWEAIRKKFYRFFGAIQHLPSFEIQYWYSESNSLTLRQGTNDEGRKSLRVDFSPNPFYKKITEDVLTHILRVQEISDKRDIFGSSTYRAALEQLSNYSEELFDDDMRLVFMPAGRSIAVTYSDFFRLNFTGTLSSDLALIKEENDVTTRFVEDTYIMLQFLKRVEALKDAFKGYSFENLLEQMSHGKKKTSYVHAKIALDKVEQILKGRYKYDGYLGEQILFNNSEYVHLSNSSSGQQEVIRILQDAFWVILNNEHAFRVIEEPEAHLFPTAQKRLLETIALMLNATDSQIFIITHSPYVLSVFTNLLFASRVAEYGLDGDEPIPVQCQLKSTETAVYVLTNGESISILDNNTGLIDQNILDEISEELAGEFDFLYTKLISQKG